LDLEQAVTQSGRESTSTPRWVKVFGVVTIVLILLFVVVVVAGIGGHHGPSRHLRFGDARGGTLHLSVTEETTPAGSGFVGPVPLKSGF
jgi:hypothetical protein